jgi:hypothetical protein
MVVEGKDEGSIAGGPVTRSPSGSLDAILCCVVRCLNVFSFREHVGEFRLLRFGTFRDQMSHG